MREAVRTLVVDDEERICFFLEETLRRAGHTVVTATSGDEALEKLRENPFDLAILDLNLGSRVDGMRLLEAIRWRWPGMAVVILTAHGSLESAMSAIREGVDGYLLKPAEPQDVRQVVREALQRRRALAQSLREEEEKTLGAGPFTIDLEGHVAARDGEPLDLTPREFDLLVHLIRNAGKVISPKELVRVARDYECEDLYEARQIIKWYIHRLRHKVEDDTSNPRYVVNVRGVGYRFVE